MIKLKQYLDYINLPEETKIEKKISVLTGYDESAISKMRISELTKILNELNYIDYDRVPAFAKLPEDYNNLTFGQWADLEHFQNQFDDPYRLCKEIAIVLDKPENEQEVLDSSKKYENLKIEEGLPLIHLHVKKKKNLKQNSQLYTKVAQILMLKRQLGKMKRMYEQVGDGTVRLSIWRRISLKLTRFSINLQVKYLRLLATKHNLIRQKSKTIK